MNDQTTNKGNDMLRETTDAIILIGYMFLCNVVDRFTR